MKIVLSIKQVPATTAEKRYTADLRLDRENVDTVINPPDGDATDQALRVALVSSLRQVDLALPGNKGSIYDILVRIRPDIVARGYDERHNGEEIAREAAKRGRREADGHRKLARYNGGQRARWRQGVDGEGDSGFRGAGEEGGAGPGVRFTKVTAGRVSASLIVLCLTRR